MVSSLPACPIRVPEDLDHHDALLLSKQREQRILIHLGPAPGNQGMKKSVKLQRMTRSRLCRWQARRKRKASSWLGTNQSAHPSGLTNSVRVDSSPGGDAWCPAWSCAACQVCAWAARPRAAAFDADCAVLLGAAGRGAAAPSCRCSGCAFSQCAGDAVTPCPSIFRFDPRLRAALMPSESKNVTKATPALRPSRSTTMRSRLMGAAALNTSATRSGVVVGSRPRTWVGQQSQELSWRKIVGARGSRQDVCALATAEALALQSAPFVAQQTRVK